jgi:PIN like domain
VSPRRRGKRPEDEHEFFLDRSLGRHEVADALRAVDLTVRTMAEVYGERMGQGLDDEEWLPEVVERGWVVLLKDDRIRRRPNEREALMRSRARVFVVTNAQITGADLAVRFVGNRYRIIQYARKNGPYVVGVYDEGLHRLLPPAES